MKLAVKLAAGCAILVAAPASAQLLGGAGGLGGQLGGTLGGALGSPLGGVNQTLGSRIGGAGHLQADRNVDRRSGRASARARGNAEGGGSLDSATGSPLGAVTGSGNAGGRASGEAGAGVQLESRQGGVVYVLFDACLTAVAGRFIVAQKCEASNARREPSDQRNINRPLRLRHCNAAGRRGAGPHLAAPINLGTFSPVF